MALRLSSPDKMRLVERIATWFEHQMEDPVSDELPSTSWGAQLAQAIQSGELDTSAWVAMDIQDSVQWLKDQRQKEQHERASRI